MENEEVGSLPGIAPVGERKAGRPSGALNRKTRVLGEWLAQSGYRDPAVVLAEIYTRPVAEIVEQLGCTALEAEKLRLGCAEALMPYLHGKMPVEVKVEDARLPVLVLHRFAGDPAQIEGREGGGALSLGRPWPEQNQGVGEVEAGQSHDGKSHDR